MNFLNLSDLYTAVSAECPGLSENAAISQLRWAAREFCAYTLASQETIETSLAIGDRDLIVQPSSQYVTLKMVMGIDGPRGPIKPVTLEELARSPNWRARTGAVTGFVEEGAPGELTLYPVSTEAETIYVRIAVIPSLTTTKLDKAIANRFAEAIADGALSRILRMSGQTWSNPAEASRRAALFDQAMSRARASAQRNHAYQPTITAPRRQF